MVARCGFLAASGGIGVAASDLQLSAWGATGDRIAIARDRSGNAGASLALLPQ